MSNDIPQRGERTGQGSREAGRPSRPTPPGTDQTEQLAVGTPTQPMPRTSGAGTPSARPSGTPAASDAAVPAGWAEPERLRGPYLAPVILGLVCLAVAGLAFAQEVANISIDWGNVGPLGIVAAGAVLVVLGALGLVASRRR
jgi:hypothetical protein